MNRWLVGALAKLNALVAVCIIAGGGLFGLTATHNPLGAVIGVIGGAFLAICLCGVLAAVCEIERHLRTLTIGTGSAHYQRDGQ